jgi:response regulator of citrate/malate metabolism
MHLDYKVLIIEDDFKIAAINRQFVEQVEGFTVIDVAKTGAEALDILVQQTPDLILLDVYIPDVDGLELLWRIREVKKNVDIIMITAAKEVSTIEETLRGGVIDYIVKPVDFSRFEQTLLRYAKKREALENKQEMGQGDIDLLWGINRSDQIGNDCNNQPLIRREQEMPKGIDPLTLNKVRESLDMMREEGMTAVELGREIGASRTTARRYLEHLISLNIARAELKYGVIGRPERRYFLQ